MRESTAHWIIKFSGGYCSTCQERVSVKTLTGEQFIDYASFPKIRKIRFNYCPFCGVKMVENPELINKE